MPKEKLNILLIDDDAGEYTFFKEALEKVDIGFSLRCVQNAMEKVYYHLIEDDIHLIFLDINMPGDNGLTFLKKLKSKEHFKNIPVVMYTVSSNDTDKEECFKLGAYRYLVKPYSEQNLVESLRKILVTDLTLSSSPPRHEDFVVNLAFA